MANYTLSARLTADASEFVRGINQAKGEMSKLESFSKRVGEGFKDFGSRIGKIGDGLTNKITKPALVAGGAVATMVGALGFRRLVGMDNARAKLRGLGYEGESVEKIMKDVDAAVTGTTHTMAEGADTAAGALAAGVKQGKDLERYIKLVGDAATGSNRSMDEMAMIFNRVQGAGKLMTMELNQIEHGMPGFSQALAKHLQVAPEEMRKMVTEGKVTSEQFLDVMEDFAGGMSDAYADTWQGIASRVLSNIGIIGETILDGLFDDGKEAMSRFVDFLRTDEVKEWATETGNQLRNVVDGIVDGLKELKSMWDSLSTPMQDNIKKFTLWGGVGLIALGPVLKIIGMVSTAIGFLIPIIGKVAGSFKFLAPIIGALFSPVGLIIAGITLLVGAFILAYNASETLQNVISDAFTMVKDTVLEAVSAVKEFVMEIFGEVVDWWHENHQLIQDTVETVWGWMSAHIGMILAVIAPLIEHTWNRIKLATSVVWEIIKGAIGIAMDFILGIITFTMKIINGDWEGAWETLKKTGEKIWGRVKDTVSKIAEKLKDALSEKFQEAKQQAIDKFEESKQGVIDKVTEMKNKVTDKAQEIVNTVKDKFNDAKNKILDPIESAKDTISGIVDDIKGFFDNMKLKIPSISLPKLPKFSLTGSFSLNPPSVPKIGVSWFAKGGIMNKPTIFGASGGKLLGGGEAGPEAILPLNDRALGGIGRGIASTMRIDKSTSNNEIARAINSLERKLTNLTMEMDEREVARIIEKPITEMQNRDVRVRTDFGR